MRKNSVGRLQAFCLGGVMLGIATAWPALAGAEGQAAVLQASNLKTLNASSDRLLIKYRNVESRAAATAAMTVERQVSLEQVAALRGLSLKVLPATAQGFQRIKLDRKLERAELKALLNELKAADASIEIAQVERLALPAANNPNDPRYVDQWSLYEEAAGIHITSAWDWGRGTDAVVAVVDTGYRPHADLATNLLPGYDFVSELERSNDGDGRDADASDPGDWTDKGECAKGWAGAGPSSWHGTSTASLIAAVTNNNRGIAGVAPDAKIVPLRVLGRCGGSDSDIADALIWAAGVEMEGITRNQNPAQVINMSLAGEDECPAVIQSALDTLREQDVLVVVAVGNGQTDAAKYWPANCKGVLNVASVGRTGARAWYSNFGDVVDIAAPGGDGSSDRGYIAANGMLVASNTGTKEPAADTLKVSEGTSFAAPHVAGVAALIRGRNPKLSVDEVEAQLLNNVRAFPVACEGCGKGLLDADKALNGVPWPGGDGKIRDEKEPNDTRKTAMAVPKPAFITARLRDPEGSQYAPFRDRDWYRVELPAGKTLTAALEAMTDRVDADLYLYDAEGKELARNPVGAGKVERVSITNSSDKATDYYVKVVFSSYRTDKPLRVKDYQARYLIELGW